jgi:hypothetical protein
MLVAWLSSFPTSENLLLHFRHLRRTWLRPEKSEMPQLRRIHWDIEDSLQIDQVSIARLENGFDNIAPSSFGPG